MDCCYFRLARVSQSRDFESGKEKIPLPLAIGTKSACFRLASRYSRRFLIRTRSDLSVAVSRTRRSFNTLTKVYHRANVTLRDVVTPGVYFGKLVSSIFLD